MSESSNHRFEELIVSFVDPLYRFAKLLVKDADRADDLVQEACLRAFKSFHLFTDGTNFKAWLFTILKNLFINQFHQRAKEVAFSQLSGSSNEDQEEINEDFFSARYTPNDRQVFKSDIEKAFNALPDKIKIVVFLKDIEGYNYKEIADLIDCPLGTVMSRLSRGRTFLKIRLRDYQTLEKYSF